MSFDSSKPVALGADHAGFEYKSKISAWLKQAGFDVKDYGTYSADSVDYPDFAHPVAEAVESGASSFGVLVCGSANGVAMSANKHQGIRAALCWQPKVAELARQHNNANIICIPARFVSEEEAREMLNSFVNTEFEGGRHLNRVNKISC